jgi:hypothetical protein
MKRLGVIFFWLAGLYILLAVAYNLYPLPSAPINVTYRPSTTGQGIIVTFQNKTDHVLHLTMQIKNPTTEEGKLSYTQLQPHESKEIDWKGFKVESGDGILVLCGGEYKKTGFVVP